MMGLNRVLGTVLLVISKYKVCFVRYVADAVILTKRLEAAIEDTKLLQAALSDYKKKLTETEAKLSMKVSEGENVRYELNTCSKNLNEAQVIVAKIMFSTQMLSLSSNIITTNFNL